MKDILTIYYGSDKIIEKPIFGEGKKHNDYGLGFYCTENIELAKEWAVSNLKKIRMISGLSQSELSKKSSVSLGSIQMYEQKNKDINKASVETVYKLSKALGCRVEDLIEI